MKDALEQAAKDDMRSVSSMVEKILTMHLRDKGYLPKGAAAGAPD
ncbi:hypothetical protein [Mesorhizobium sp. AR10]|nr:hypothetical protein [Mesorhizobium sp. AR10]